MIGRTLARVIPLRAWGRPVVAGLSLGVLYALFAARAATAPLTDPDVGWIAAAGREMLATQRVPRTNGWSFVDGELPWVMHEWLLAPLYALGMRDLGAPFFALAGMCAALVTTALLLCATVGSARYTGGGTALAFIALAAGRECLFSPRPAHLLLGLPLAMLLLATSARWTLARTVAALALQLAWTNAHGSFPLGVGLLAVGAIAHGDDRPRARWTTAGAALLLTFANPYGPRLHGLVDRYLRGGDPTAEVLRSNVTEFAPLWAMREPWVNGRVLAGLAVVLALALFALRVGDRAMRTRAVCALAVVGLAVLQCRHAVLAVMLGCTLLVPAMDSWMDRVGVEAQPRVGRRWWIATLLPGALLGLLLWGRTRPVHPDEALGTNIGGFAVLRLAGGLPASARLWTPFETTGTALWAMRPRGGRILYDARNDCASSAVARAAFALEDPAVSDVTVREAFDRYGVTDALAPVQSAVSRALDGDSRWRRTRSVGQWSAWRRTVGDGRGETSVQVFVQELHRPPPR